MTIGKKVEGVGMEMSESKTPKVAQCRTYLWTSIDGCGVAIVVCRVWTVEIILWWIPETGKGGSRTI